MKYLFLSVILFSFNSSFSQEVIEKLVSMNKKHNDFWTGKKSNILLEFQKTYTLDASTDTTLRLYINVNNKEYETVGVSTNVNILSVGSRFFGSAGASSMEKVIRQKGTYILDRDEINKLVDACNKIYSTLKNWQYKKTDHDHLITYHINDEILLAGDYSDNNLGSKGIAFIFQFEDILFRFEEIDYIEVSKYLKLVKDTWNKIIPKT